MAPNLLESERLVPPPSELRPALAEAMRRVQILRRLLRLSESVATTPCSAEPREVHHAAAAR